MLNNQVSIRTHRSLRALCAGFVSAALFGGVAQAAEDWPVKPVTSVVAFSPGGTTDILAREIANALTPMWGQSVVVENKPGGAGNIGTQAVISAEPDGYTILINSIGPIAVNPSLFSKLKFDPQKDLVPIVLVADVPNVLVVNPNSGIKSVEELIQASKSRAGGVNCASTGVGTAAHLSCETFARQAKIEFTHIPYKGAEALNDLIGGRVDFMFATMPSVMGHIRAGTLRPLAVSTATRSVVMPDLPTVAEAGLPEFALGSWFGYFAPKGTPDHIVQKINADINTVLQDPNIKQRLTNEGAVPVGGTAEEFAAYVASETKKWNAVVTEVGIKLD
ncbi:tripartite tricarboxylate transporter substrate binding protein [Pusillimonas sp. MFBS29]|uniref:Bug family tripartite tricarboxylate transporter substrate binding protein n=1 Tax=Pusillimonas sp. MFBS29 TaxID=2886690 RepID=UPI001D128CAF|nr:tripartite tricarboxylate transporter substrate binding protein [Pusillimonas sp. MFBS29]MCC2595576.1 tripartite tricarboxylate transporter substrate binding protein [Pusillimonas sp. MFBS29]